MLDTVVGSLDECTSDTDNGDYLDDLYMDFAKAFDFVPQKLLGYGIGGTVLRWINAFLSVRHQTVVLKGHCIEFKDYADGIHSGLTPPGNNS